MVGLGFGNRGSHVRIMSPRPVKSRLTDKLSVGLFLFSRPPLTHRFGSIRLERAFCKRVMPGVQFRGPSGIAVGK